ncbi:hypothetical protein HRI_000069200 [Hibiscus trionum]|uniref:Retrovirus-related Pol polyprotein from transposon TNT 1-94-like beta-barrel domain-containing protein n=1 Tax=Hibiscus trionum TaxID=183268 RepID=A0A9W7GQS8_HIBTR|nr:hypothetical protein HRI_000069200 [Hibiscus trionum]
MAIESYVSSSSISTSLTSFTSNYSIQQMPKLDTVKLSENTYVIWKHQVLLIVEGYGLIPFILDHEVPAKTIVDQTGVTVSNPIFLTYLKQDRLLASWLLSTISADVLPHLTGLNTSQGIWNALARRYGAKSSTKVSSLCHSLHSQKKRGLSVSEYLGKIKQICDTLSASRNVVTEQEQMSVILAGLTAEFESVIVVASRETQTLKSLSEMLFDCEARQKEFMSDSFSIQANVVTHVNSIPDDSGDKDEFNSDQFSNSSQFARGHRGNNFFRGRGRGRFGSNRPQCQLCRKYGHLVQKCYYRFDHSLTGLPNTRNEYVHSNHTSNFGPKIEPLVQSFSPTPIQAYSHTFSSTPPTPYVANYTPFVPLVSGTVPVTLPPNSSSVLPSAVFPSAHFSPAYPRAHGCGTTGSRDVVWYPDSGATHYITNDRANLQFEAVYRGMDSLLVGNGSEVRISHIGCGTLMSGVRSMNLSNLLCAPDIKKNLLSVSKFARDNDVFF